MSDYIIQKCQGGQWDDPRLGSLMQAWRANVGDMGLVAFANYHYFTSPDGATWSGAKLTRSERDYFDTLAAAPLGVWHVLAFEPPPFHPELGWSYVAVARVT